MTLTDFITYALAKKQIEYHSYDPRAKYQCVDLTNDYITKVWGLEAIIGTDAKDFPERLKPGMEYVPNTTDYLPEAGEVVVWNGKVGGGAGHIAIVLKKGLQTVFYSLDQNWSKPLFITQEKHTYGNVRGFIRKKGAMAKVELDSKVFEELVSKSSKYDEFVKAGFKSANDVSIRIAELEKSLAQKPKEIIKEVVITKEVPVEIIKEVIVEKPNDTLGALQLITLAVQAIVAGRW